MSQLSSGKPTIKDVARACGVSAATVSYVISGTRVLKPETRARVLRAMEEMNYHPSAVARGLQSKRVHTIGVHCGVVRAHEFITNHYASGLLSGILERAEAEGFDVTLFTHPWRGAAQSAPMLCDGRTDGMIVIAPPLECDIAAELGARQMPIVAISAATQTGVAGVDVDNAAGAQMAARHLLELGHTRIAALFGNEDLSSFAPRRQGFIEALQTAGVAVNPEWLLVSRFDGSLALEQTRALLQPAPGQQVPTAIWAGNDAIAIAVIEAARELGVEVPAQLSVIGFDDAPAASVVTPRLTTIHQPLRAIGECAAALLIDRICGRSAPDDQSHHRLCPQLIVRDSTAVPATIASATIASATISVQDNS